MTSYLDRKVNPFDTPYRVCTRWHNTGVDYWIARNLTGAWSEHREGDENKQFSRTGDAPYTVWSFELKGDMVLFLLQFGHLALADHDAPSD